MARRISGENFKELFSFNEARRCQQGADTIPFMNHTNPINILTSHFCKIQFNIIHPFKLRYSKRFSTFSLSDQILSLKKEAVPVSETFISYIYTLLSLYTLFTFNLCDSSAANVSRFLPAFRNNLLRTPQPSLFCPEDRASFFET